MSVRQSLLIRILVGLVFVFPFTGRATAGYFPNRHARYAGAKLTTLTGVLTFHDLGNDTGAFGLRTAGKDATFMVGLPMHMNRKVVTCGDPDLSADCQDWPPEIALGKSVVTATCYWVSDLTNPGATINECFATRSIPNAVRNSPTRRDHFAVVELTTGSFNLLRISSHGATLETGAEFEPAARRCWLLVQELAQTGLQGHLCRRISSRTTPQSRIWIAVL
jgi:hypothetical protein